MLRSIARKQHGLHRRTITQTAARWDATGPTESEKTAQPRTRGIPLATEWDGIDLSAVKQAPFASSLAKSRPSAKRGLNQLFRCVFTDLSHSIAHFGGMDRTRNNINDRGWTSSRPKQVDGATSDTVEETQPARGQTSTSANLKEERPAPMIQSNATEADSKSRRPNSSQDQNEKEFGFKRVRPRTPRADNPERRLAAKW